MLPLTEPAFFALDDETLGPGTLSEFELMPLTAKRLPNAFDF